MSIFDRKNISGSFDWNEVYSLDIDVDEYKKVVVDWKSQLRRLKEENRLLMSILHGGISFDKKSVINSMERVLDESVKWSVKNNSNELFSLALIDYLMSYNDDVYNPFINRITQGFDKKNNDAIRFMKPSIWNNPGIEYDDVDDESLFYNKADRFLVGTMSADYPRKELIIQYALAFGLDSKTTNLWLKMAGRDKLYTLDIVDIVCRFYLDFYSSNSDNTKDDIEYRLKNVKSKINYYMNLVAQNSRLDENEWGIKLKALEDGVYFEDKNSVSDYNWRKKEWSFLKLLNETRNKTFGKDSNEKSLTIYIDNKLLGKEEIVDEDELDKIINDNITLFRQVHYSLTEKNIEYLSDIDRIRKNLYFYTNQVVYKGDEFSTEAGKNTIKMAVDRERMNPEISDLLSGSKKKLTTLLNIANSVIGSENILESEFFFRTIKGNSSNSLRNKILGRGKNVGGEKGYYLEKMSIVTAMKYCLGTGNEDEIGEYMRLCGYWDFDLIDIYKREDHKDDIYFLTPGDLYLLFLFKLRDQILVEWYSDSMDVDMKVWMNDMRSKFPIVALSALVSRDIQLVSKKMYSDYYEDLIIRFIPFCTENSNMYWYE